MGRPRLIYNGGDVDKSHTPEADQKPARSRKLAAAFDGTIRLPRCTIYRAGLSSWLFLRTVAHNCCGRRLAVIRRETTAGFGRCLRFFCV